MLTRKERQVIQGSFWAGSLATAMPLLPNRCCMLLRCCSRPRVLPTGAPADRSDEAERPADGTCARLRTSFAEEHSAGLFPLFAIRASQVMALKHMRSHEELKPRPWNPSDGPLCFVSHQWTARDAPDHTGQQLAVLQHTLAHIHDLMTDPTCNLAHAKPPIAPEDYSRLYVWLDYWSVPQSDGRASERC
ncbi:hypothetical protein AB1Y20_004114 [Prymnesium parvum]|uniref:Uncharacterized protein n=1 Tax=Prymnesium parvum TaxID=97485 RepID=A0AB34J905_PRYPA